MTIKVQGNVIFDANRVANIHNVVSIAAGGSLRVSSDDSFQGTVAGYVSGGIAFDSLPSPFQGTAYIQKFPFATDTNSTFFGSLAYTGWGRSGHSSPVSGYTAGGYPGATPFSPAGTLNAIHKFSFSAGGSSVFVGTLTQGRRDIGGGVSSSQSGYASGGNAPPQSNTIDKFPFSIDSNASDVGDLTQARERAAGHSSSTFGYVSGGLSSSPPTVRSNTIDKFPFASDTNASDVGDLTVDNQEPAGQSSTTSGYSSGGYGGSPAAFLNIINKFPFASDTNASDIGDLTVARTNSSGQSSSVSGYTSTGRISSPPVDSNVIDKFPFSSDTNATDVGDLSVKVTASSGHQN